MAEAARQVSQYGNGRRWVREDFVPNPVMDNMEVPAPVASAVAFHPHPLSIRLSAREKVTMILVIATVAAVFIGMVFLSAYCATIQKDINRTNAQMAVIQEDIDNLQLAIEQKKNIAVIESRAEALGMVYPDAEAGQLLYLADLKQEIETGGAAEKGEANEDGNED
jgi:cell division protein FtsL